MKDLSTHIVKAAVFVGDYFYVSNPLCGQKHGTALNPFLNGEKKTVTFAACVNKP